MATFDSTPQAQEERVHGEGAHQSSSGMSVDNVAINGSAIQHNSLASLPSPPQDNANFPSALENHQKSPAPPLPPISSEDNPAIPDQTTLVPNNIESGISPVAPFVAEAELDQTAAAEIVDVSMLERDNHAAEATPAVVSSTSAVAPSTPAAAPAPSASVPTAPDTSTIHSSTHIPAPHQSMGQDQRLPTTSDSIASAPHITNGISHPTKSSTANDMNDKDTDMTDAPITSTKVAREREDDDEGEPSAKRARTENGDDVSAVGTISQSVPTTSDSAAPMDVDSLPSSQPYPSIPGPSTVNEPSTVAGPSTSTSTATAPLPPTAPPQISAADRNWGSLTEAQTRQLKQNIQNLKKGRHAVFFSKPVDPVALNVPSYPEIIKHPMDLGTLEQNMREGKYSSVSDYIRDFDLIISNAHTFNGRYHAVSVAADNLRAQFYAGLRKVPEAGQQPPPPTTLPSRDLKVRGARHSLPNPTASAISSEPTFALAGNGIPTVRRTSTNFDGRPKREIKPVGPRDMPYSTKPKKKKFQMELKFADHVMSELKRARYAHFYTPFASPVDPVALNIPHYHKFIKKPMDFGTVSKNLQAGAYENLKEFEHDVRLIFKNCIEFNGPQSDFTRLANEMSAIFESEMNKKTSWITHNAPASAPQSAEGESDLDGDDDAGAEEEDEEEDESEDKAEQLRRIQKQIADLSAAAMALTSVPVAKAKTATKKASSKTARPAPEKSHKKSTAAAGTKKRPSSGATSKPKAKTQRPLTNAQKEEIANRIGELDTAQTAKAAEHIKAGLRRIGRADLADRPDDELEFDIGTIPEEALQAIFKMIKSRDIPGDYRTAPATHRGGAPPPKAKKNKPMTKQEQEATIRRLENQSRAFEGASVKPDASSPNDEDDDDDDSGSESEEE